MVIKENIKGIIFDLDGTLFNLNVDWDDLRAGLNKLTGKQWMRIHETLVGFNDEHRASAKELIDDAELKGVTEGDVPMGVKKALRSTKQYKRAIVTRNGRAASNAVLKKLKMDDCTLVCRDDVERLKPHPEALEIALGKIQLRPNECIVVGDTTHDVYAAHALSMICIIVKNQKLSYPPDNADFYIETMAELSGIIENINEK